MKNLFVYPPCRKYLGLVHKSNISLIDPLVEIYIEHHFDWSTTVWWTFFCIYIRVENISLFNLLLFCLLWKPLFSFMKIWDGINSREIYESFFRQLEISTSYVSWACVLLYCIFPYSSSLSCLYLGSIGHFTVEWEILVALRTFTVIVLGVRQARKSVFKCLKKHRDHNDS